MNTDHLHTLANTRAELMLRIRKCTEELTRTEDEASDQYSTLKERLTLLHRKLNTIAPIAHLPTEVLGAVFYNYVLNHWDLYLSQTKDSQIETPDITPYSWFAILHICHHWRHVALSNPALWTHVVPTNDQCVEFVLSKSGHLPLTISSDNNYVVGFGTGRLGFQAPSATKQNAYDNILQRLPRIRTANLCVHPYYDLSPALAESMNPEAAADMLEELCLDMDPYIGGQAQRTSVFTSKAMRGLRSLRVIDGTLNFVQSLLRPSLTTLEATFVDMGPSLDGLVLALSQLPLLQRMTLRSLPWMLRSVLPNVLPPPLHIATLPQLKYMSLEGLALVLAEFVHCLVFPSDTVIRLQSEIGGSVEESRLALSSLLPKVVGSVIPDPGNGTLGPRLRPRSLLLEHEPLKISLWRTVQSWPLNEDENISSEEPDLHMFIPFDINAEIVIADFMAALDLSEVVTMNLRRILPADAFEHLALPKLESIRVFNEANAEAFFMAINTRLTQPQPTLGEDGEAASSYYLFPDLKRLELDTVVCHDERYGSPVEDFITTVTKSLQLRAECVRKLEQLWLVHPINLLPSDYQALYRSRSAQSYEVHDAITDYSEDEMEDGEDGERYQEMDGGDNLDLE